MVYEEEECDNCNIKLTFENSGDCAICKDCQKINAEHKQVESSFGPLIDEELVEIINALHDSDVMTNNSCQQQTNKRHNNKTWICFDSLKDVEKFMKICKLDTKFHKFILEQEWDIIVESKDILNIESYEYSLRFSYKDLNYFKKSFVSCTLIITQMTDSDSDSYSGLYTDDNPNFDSEKKTNRKKMVS